MKLSSDRGARGAPAAAAPKPIASPVAKPVAKPAAKAETPPRRPSAPSTPALPKMDPTHCPTPHPRRRNPPCGSCRRGKTCRRTTIRRPRRKTNISRRWTTASCPRSMRRPTTCPAFDTAQRSTPKATNPSPRSDAAPLPPAVPLDQAERYIAQDPFVQSLTRKFYARSSRRVTPIAPSSMSRCHPQAAMTTCSQGGRMSTPRLRCRPSCLDAQRTAPANHRPSVAEFAERSDKEGWQATRLIGALFEHELARRAKRRIERHRAKSHLVPTKTRTTFDRLVYVMLCRNRMPVVSVDPSVRRSASRA